MRRLVGRTVSQVFRDQLREQAGALQFGLAKDGTGALHRKLSYHMAVHKTAILVSVDVADAFSGISRRHVAETVSQKIPELFPLVEGRLGRPSNGRIPDT